LKRDNVAEQVTDKGSFFAKGMEELANKYDYPLKMTGPASMPYPWFDGDDDLFLLQNFCRLAAGEGLFFHPHHNWFISNAHNKESLGAALDRVEQIFEKMGEAKA
jgi:glutamate-1-semialdehyde 2,1-aminomutase